MTRTGDDGVRHRHRRRVRRGGQGPPRAVPAPDQGDHRAARLGAAWPLRGPGAGRRGAVGGSRRWWCRSTWPGWPASTCSGRPRPAGLSDWVADGRRPCGDEAWEAARIEAGVPVERPGGRRRGPSPPRSAWSTAPSRSPRGASPARSWWPGWTPGARRWPAGCAAWSSTRTARRPGPPPCRSARGVLTADGAHEVGHLSSVAWSPGLGATVALATLHRRVAPPEAVVVRWDGDDGTRDRRPRADPCRCVGG